MNILKFTKSAFSTVLGALAITASFPAVPPIEAEGASICMVNTSKTYQTIKGFGGMNLPEWMGSDLTDAQRKTAFGNGADQLGLTIVRVYISDDKDQWKNALATAKYAKSQGAIVFATPWNPPTGMRETFTKYITEWNGNIKTLTNQRRLRHDKYAEYAQHLNDFYHYMKDNGVELFSISIQNEPDYGEDWTWMSEEECVDFLANYADKIDCPVMSPESFSYNKSYYNAILNNAKANANVDVWGTHFYGTSRENMDFPVLENDKRDIFMTEVYVPDSSSDADTYPQAIKVSKNIHDGLVVGNMNAYVWWYIRRSYGPMKENGNISKRGYCMAQYSKFVRPGDVRVDATESPATDVWISAYKNDKSQVTVVAINNSDTEYNQVFDVGQSITDVDRYRTSAYENLAPTLDMNFSGSGFNAQLPARSVSTFVITVDGNGGSQVIVDPIDENPDSNGYYFHDTFEESTGNWTGHGTSDVTLSGRTPYKDTNALLTQNRTGSWNGTEKALPSSFKAGQEYSFSVCAEYLDGSDTQDFKLSLQYKDASGTTKYSNIATATAVKGQYVQLANKNYKLPEGSDFTIYVETAKGTDNFYIDEAIGAKAGTSVSGPEAPIIPQKTEFTLGDINNDGKINSFDMIIARKALAGTPFANDTAKSASDVNGDGKFNVEDAVQISEFILGKRKSFTASENTGNSSAETTAHLSMSDFTAKIQSKVVEKEPDSSHAEQAGVKYGTVKSATYWSTTCNRQKKYNVLLPADYDPSKKYPVLYVMHGYWENQDRMITAGNGTMYTRQIIGNAIASGEAKDMIVVFPYIYSSTTKDKCDAMDDENNQAYDNFINDLTKDLMPEIEKNYSIKTGRDNTAITGFSMGGRESLLIGMQRSDLFGYVGAICPAPGVTGSFKWDSGKEPYLLMITAGSNDNVVYNNPETYHNNFTKNAVPHIYHYVNGGYHGDNSIHAHLYNFCRAVFQN